MCPQKTHSKIFYNSKQVETIHHIRNGLIGYGIFNSCNNLDDPQKYHLEGKKSQPAE